MTYLVTVRIGAKRWFYKGQISAAESGFTTSTREAKPFEDSVTATRVAQKLKLKHIQLRGRKVAVTNWNGEAKRVKKNPSAKGAFSLWSRRFSIARGWEWRIERGVTAENSAEWLKVFQRDEPGIQFKISRARPKITVKSNPSARSRGLVEEAAHRFEAFTGHRAGKEYYFQDRRIDVGLAVGKLSGVMYEATRDGETSQYFHKFKKSSRPLLIAAHDGSKLGIVGGRYQFTERGIEDR